MPRGDKPTTVAAARKFGWVYEDQLPAISNLEYDWWYRESLVLDGVRMGPPVVPLREIRERLLKMITTIGPLTVGHTPGSHRRFVTVESDGNLEANCGVEGERNDVKAEFFAHAQEDIRYLLELVGARHAH